MSLASVSCLKRRPLGLQTLVVQKRWLKSNATDDCLKLVDVYKGLGSNLADPIQDTNPFNVRPTKEAYERVRELELRKLRDHTEKKKYTREHVVIPKYPPSPIKVNTKVYPSERMESSNPFSNVFVPLFRGKLVTLRICERTKDTVQERIGLQTLNITTFRNVPRKKLPMTKPNFDVYTIAVVRVKEVSYASHRSLVCKRMWKAIRILVEQGIGPDGEVNHQNAHPGNYLLNGFYYVISSPNPAALLTCSWHDILMEMRTGLLMLKKNAEKLMKKNNIEPQRWETVEDSPPMSTINKTPRPKRSLS